MSRRTLRTPGPRRARRERRPGRRRLAIVLVVAGVVAVLSAGGWLVSTWTLGSHSSRTGVEAAEGHWERQRPGRTLRLGLPDPPSPGTYRPGETVAVLSSGRLGDAWRSPVLEGVGAPVLRKGTGHYPGTAVAGGRGNFAVAGHRTTWSHPFRDADRLRTGDTIVVDTMTARLVYRVVSREIVSPDDLGVLAPVDAELPQAERLLTLTTCHPLFSARQRLTVRAVYDPDASGVWVAA